MTERRPGLSRRALLGGAGAGALAVGGGLGYVTRSATADTPSAAPDPAAMPVAFDGRHQAGITTPAQDRLHLAVFDVVTTDRDELDALLQEWTAAARKMCSGNDVGDFGSVAGPAEVPPEDTGEAQGLPPSALTLTIGFGPSLFETADGQDRFGLAAKRPAALVDLPAFSGDRLRPEVSGGDIVVQACANDPQVAVHAIRNLVRIGFGVVSIRYSQLGFGRTSSTSRAQATPRNLFGFKDGTANIKSEDTRVVDEHVWVGDDADQDWMVGGSYMVNRKIMMRIETWDRESLAGQENIIGRTKGSGGPMSGGDELDEPDFDAKAADGEPAIALKSHVRLAHPDFNGGAQILRRGYNFVEGNDDLGQLAAGLFFICFQDDPATGFVPIQRSLAGPSNDLMNEYVTHVGSGVFACPGGLTADGYWGQALLAR
ncbi:iron uptake transporter deferrochelatase/peroxidase subunit [Solicola sp. PLA-1-18]|uniref:iron uptake transporter deferrochelatase/peroxidase subunit n=1 Tax=Solicola sp. PLA-1-18 TaxID=3380532 RepID=UPI003B82A0E8